MAITVKYNPIDKESIAITLTITAKMSEWRLLAQQLPTSQIACAMLKEKLSAMLSDKTLLTTKI